MADAKPKKTASKKIADVKRGGDAASGTTRQIIINNRPIMKDPMMAEVTELANAQAGLSDDSEPDAKTEPQPEPAKVKRSTKIKPISLDTDSIPKAAKPTAESQPEPAGEPTEVTASEPAQSASEVASEPVAEAAAPAVSDEPAEPSPPADDKTDPAPAEPVTIEPPTDAKDEVAEEEAPAETVPPETPEPSPEPADTPPEPTTNEPAQPGRSTFADATTASEQTDETQLDEKGNPKKAAKPTGGELTTEQQKAVDSGQYFLPITTAETRRLRRELLLATLLIILLLAAWLDILLDAGFLKLGGLHALTNFFQ